MTVRYVGIVTNSGTSQGSINVDHAHDIRLALEKAGFVVSSYDLTKQTDIKRMMADRGKQHLDMVFNNSAGRLGGDGTVEGLLELLHIPYVGSDVLATSVAFDKKTTKAVVATHGVPIIRGLSFSREQYDTRRRWVISQIEKLLKYPVVIKASQGSDSIGVSLVRRKDQIVPALELAFAEDDQVIVEDFIKRLAEITCLVLGNGEQTYALQPVERVYEGDILLNRDLQKRDYRIPTQIDQRILEKIGKYSVIAHTALDCSDYSRSDFLITRRGQIYFLELNAHAGLGKVGPSMFAAKATHNWNHSRFMKEIVQIAAARSEDSTLQ